MRFQNLWAKAPEEKILKKLDCRPDSIHYEEFLEEYREIRDEALAQIKPMGAMAFAVIPESMAAPEIPAGSEVACVITNIGDGISAYTSRFFAEGDFVRGMLANA